MPTDGTRRYAMTFPLAPGVSGGGTRDCIQLVRHMARAGARLHLLAAASGGPGRFPRPALTAEEAGGALVSELAHEGVEVELVTAHRAHYLLDGVPMRRAVARLLDREPVDALVGWWHEAAFLGDLLEERGVPFAMNAAASYRPLLERKGRRPAPLFALRAARLIKAPLRRARTVFVRSSFSRTELVELAGIPPDRIRVVPCGVDTSLCRVPRAAGGDGPRRILFFGRFEPSKGVYDALAALGRLARKGCAGWSLRVAGWGDSERVRRVAREHGLAERLELVGGLAHPDLVAELAATDLALLPSYTESFGLANAEAQALGVPVVAYAAGAVPEVVEDGVTGWLVRTGDVDALARAVEAALDAPQELARRGAAGRERIARHFSWERAAAATLAGLDELRAPPS